MCSKNIFHELKNTLRHTHTSLWGHSDIYTCMSLAHTLSASLIHRQRYVTGWFMQLRTAQRNLWVTGFLLRMHTPLQQQHHHNPSLTLGSSLYYVFVLHLCARWWRGQTRAAHVKKRGGRIKPYWIPPITARVGAFSYYRATLRSLGVSHTAGNQAERAKSSPFCPGEITATQGRRR